MNNTDLSRLEELFPEVADRLDLTGHEISRRVLRGLPDPLPERRLPGLVSRGLELHGSRSKLARACGYANLCKGSRRIDEWTAGTAFPLPAQDRNVAAGLGIAPGTLREAILDDKRLDWMLALKRRAQNPSFRLVIRLMAAIYCPRELSPDLTLREALNSARILELKPSLKCRRCLDLPDDTQIFLTADGDRESVCMGNPVSGGLVFRLEPGTGEGRGVQSER